MTSLSSSVPVNTNATTTASLFLSGFEAFLNQTNAFVLRGITFDTTEDLYKLINSIEDPQDGHAALSTGIAFLTE